MLIYLYIDGIVTMKLKAFRRLFPFIFLIVLLVIVASPLKTSGQKSLQVYNLRTGESYETIQEAIDASRSRDTLYVGIGTYYENLVVNKTISLIGENKSDTIIDGDDRGNVISVTADNVEIRGFTIQGGSEGTQIRGGIYVQHSSGNKIVDNVIKDNEYGIYLSYSAENSVLNNTIIGNRYGLKLLYAANNVFSNNGFSLNSNGIRLEYSINNTFSENNVSLTTFDGIFAIACTDNVFSNNRVNDNNFGFRLSASASNNFFENNVSKNNQGFSLSSSFYNLFSGNNVSLNRNYGVWLGASGNNVFFNNYLVNNEVSFRLLTSNYNLIYHNNFVNTILDTAQKPSSIESQNSWDNGIEGNYWSTFDGSDTNKNGISDMAYVINENNNDSYPLMGVFTQFNVMVGDRAYTFDIVSNSTISNFRYIYYQANKTAAVSFYVSNVEGKCFCRICTPNDLVEPSYTIIAKYNISLRARSVYSNKTHTWLYFEYDYSKYGPTTILLLSQEQPIWYHWWFWAMIVLTAVAMILFSFVIKYHRMSIKQKKLIQAYESELQLRVNKHLDTARTFFEADKKRRNTKIEQFEKKYNVKIRRPKSFEDVIRTLEFKKKEKKATN